jgi:Fe-S-cluster containining protein
MPRRSSADARGRLFHRAEDWFHRGQAAALDTLPCREGCSRCCHGPFAITLIEYLELQEGLHALPAHIQDAIHARARAQAATMQATFPMLAQSPSLDDWHERTLDELVTRFGDLPCPALDADGCCLVYTRRPITCRMMGLPVETDGLVHGACDVQTFVPITRVSQALRQEENRVAAEEARLIAEQREDIHTYGEEILLTYGFLPSAIA